MSHFYHPQKDGTAKLMSSITSPAKARKTGALASVTTMLGLIPSDFLSKWTRQQVFTMAKSGLTFEECEERRYGMRRDVDGRFVTSSSFGTSVHKALEVHLERMSDGDLSPNNGPYNAYVNPFSSWFKDGGYSLVAAETTVFCLKRKTAGTIDVLAKDASGDFVLLDFKTRAVRDDVKPESKTYLKDCAQLAVEAEIVREFHDLDYMPRIMSIVIATDDGRTGIKRWKPDQAAFALTVFDACANLYNTINKL
jgi:hypothetical protein